MWVSCPIVPAPFASLCSEPAVPTEGSSGTGSWICWMLSRAGTCSKELFQTQNPAGFSRRVVWSGPCLAPTAREPRQRQQHKQVWAALGQRSSRGIGVTAGQGSGKEPNLGLSMIQPLTCVCVCGYCQAQTQIRALPVLSHPSQHGERGGKGTRHPGLFSRVKSALSEGSGHCQGSLVSFSLLRIPLPSLAVGVVYMEHFKSRRSCGRTFFFRSVTWQSHK